MSLHKKMTPKMLSAITKKNISKIFESSHGNKLYFQYEGMLYGGQYPEDEELSLDTLQKWMKAWCSEHCTFMISSSNGHKCHKGTIKPSARLVNFEGEELEKHEDETEVEVVFLAFEQAWKLQGGETE